MTEKRDGGPGDHTVRVLPSTAEWLTSLGVFGTVGVWIVPERAAWIGAVLRLVEDTDDAFPHGKWATIQSIDGQVNERARALLASRERKGDGR